MYRADQHESSRCILTARQVLTRVTRNRLTVTKAPEKPAMRKIIFVLLSIFLIACASKTRKTYPDNGSVVFWDISAGGVGGSLNSKDVTLHYKGAFKDNIEELGVIAAKVSGKEKQRADVLEALLKEAIQLKADGIYEIDVTQDGDTFKADGVAFRFKPQ